MDKSQSLIKLKNHAILLVPMERLNAHGQGKS